ncbi:efflux RND transporter periplasmic adaptor subunit [Tautonia sociabilis]|uniref:Efflux RND transporter periplasmic adaptor subunit n=1 Tax=Tautonia sociabilis TaxID=2080755 RepID=A0A432MPN4_9BACT|nr:efflux RND transporter periplasmic adaptor subunit [Tautonia sociabilis]RUL89127.1 efflux RND transporter periplasmic adaptor subunit [Tautonia sociabilis]
MNSRGVSRSRSRFRPRLAIAAGAVLASMAAGAPAGAQSGGPTPVASSTVVRRSVAEGRSFVGSVMPVRQSTVGSTVEERVAAFLVEEGQRVEQGQPLVQLRTKTLEIELAGAKAELEALRQELAELENGTRPEEIKRGEAELARAAALRDYAQAARRRFEDLTRRSQASPQELDEAISNAEAAAQAYNAARAALDLLIAGPRAEQVARARAKVSAQEEVVRRLEDRLAEHTIVAPFTGYVAAEHTEVGQWLGQGDPVVELVELDEVDVAINVIEDDIRYIHAGTPARVEVGALPEEAFTGAVAIIVPKADLRSRTFPVKVRLPNDASEGDPLLKAGMLARVTLPVGPEHDSLLVLKDALVLGGAEPIVWVIDGASGDPAAGTVRPVPVTLGVAEGALIEVIGPLEAGAQIVVQGNERLKPGQEVQVIRTVDPGADTVASSRTIAR